MTDMPPPTPEDSPARETASTPPTPPPAPTSSAGAIGPLGTQRSIGMTIFLTIVTLGIWTWVWSYQNGDEIKRHANAGLGGVAYLLITVFIAPVTMFLMAAEVEQLYRREGKEPPITTIWGLWFLLPIIGNLIWYVRIQKSINDYWTAHGVTPI
jgi:hypothetical protein